jgi:hypothetical protein
MNVFVILKKHDDLGNLSVCSVGKAYFCILLIDAWLIRHLFKWDSTVATGSRNGASISQAPFFRLFLIPNINCVNFLVNKFSTRAGNIQNRACGGGFGEANFVYYKNGKG